MNALVFADSHIHNHKGSVDRLADCIEALDWAFQQAYVYNCSHVFFLGDLLHDRAKIDVLTYLRTFEAFMKHLSAPFDIWLLVGNHDMYVRRFAA